jgi:sterol desaturase/sphingolipid hydroxylase (fatty acid hydroxylase superfamily)
MFYTLLYILSYDIWFYFSHVVLHSKRYYHIHKEHHTRVTNLKYPDTFVANHLETLIQPHWSIYTLDVLSCVYLFISKN